MAKKPNIKKIFENKYELVIDKPANIMTHPDGRKEEYTLADYLKENHKMDGIGEEGREGIVHRLDTDTTGVMIFALAKESFNFLKRQFQEHTMKKVYRAIVVGHIKNDTGIIDAPISRSKSDFRKKNVKNIFENDGKGDVRGKERDAVTRYKVIKRLKSKTGKPYTYVECYPETGRTHQIRVHLKSIRHPILGDSLYGVKEKESEQLQKEFKAKLNRPFLHAYSLEVKILDDDGKKVLKKFVAKEHDDIKKVLEELGYLC